jgi:hypothetical protein
MAHASPGDASDGSPLSRGFYDLHTSEDEDGGAEVVADEDDSSYSGAESVDTTEDVTAFTASEESYPPDDESFEEYGDDGADGVQAAHAVPGSVPAAEPRPAIYVGTPQIYVAPYQPGRYAFMPPGVGLAAQGMSLDRLRPTLLEELAGAGPLGADPGAYSPQGGGGDAGDAGDAALPEWYDNLYSYPGDDLYGVHPYHFILNGMTTSTYARSNRRPKQGGEERRVQPIPVTDEDEPRIEAAWPSAFGPELYKMCVCPILGSVMRDPVVAADGHTYERSALVTWYRTCRKRQFEQTGIPGTSFTSPLTGEPMQSTWVSNHSVRQLISHLLEMSKKSASERPVSTAEPKEPKGTKEDRLRKDSHLPQVPQTRRTEGTAVARSSPDPRPESRSLSRNESRSRVLLPPLR